MRHSTYTGASQVLIAMSRMLVLAVLAVLTVLALQAAPVPESVTAADRFGGPFNAGDVFPTTMQPLHPLNPADLAKSTEIMLQFGIQPDGRNLILGLPNFLLALSNQTLDWTSPTGQSKSYDARKLELGYGISTTDLNLTAEGALAFALGFNLRYLDYMSTTKVEGAKVENTFGDIGFSSTVNRFHVDLVLLNLAKLSAQVQDSLPGNIPREFNFGLTYGMPADWQISARIGIQDTNQGQSIVDLGFEKIFFQNVTFRIGSQRRYAFSEGNSATEVKSSLSGGLWYRLNAFGTGYHYPDLDRDFFSVPTLLRTLRDIEVGGLVALTKTPETAGRTAESSTSLLLTVGKTF